MTHRLPLAHVGLPAMFRGSALRVQALEEDALQRIDLAGCGDLDENHMLHLFFDFGQHAEPGPS